mmetsp:Transcript_28732/g.69169  ORF Transcript_28732/g.69169 Transcript_28732/m.69169 type:complete len:407 (-) Transcript_28732:38-1258(-)
MPAPVAIRDPSTYYEKREDPASVLGLEDPVVPLRNFLAMQKSDVVPSHHHSSVANADESTARNKHHVDDISISPRLLGYVLSFISSAVGMISATIFYVRETTMTTSETIEDYADSLGIELNQEQLDKAKARTHDMSKYELYFGTGGSIVVRWKVYGCIAVEGLLTIITLAILIAHYDSILCVKKNRVNFRDGSLFERNLLVMLIILSICALYICTSKFSVGEAQANVFFSTWTNFISCVINYEVWRRGKRNRHYTFREALLGRNGKSHLMRHWYLLAILSTITFLSTIDFFLNNNTLADCDHLDCMDLSWTNHWVWFSLAGFVICWAVVLLHRYCKLALVVRMVEAIVSLVIIGAYGYIVASFTGGRLDQVPCPSNLYFSVWGGFFLSVWIFSTVVEESRGLVQDV